MENPEKVIPKGNTEKKEANNIILIGKKPLKNYIDSIKMQLRNSNNSEIILKARGQFITKAIDAAEVAKRSPGLNLSSRNIIIDTEEYEKQDEKRKRKIRVSTIEISLSKLS